MYIHTLRYILYIRKYMNTCIRHDNSYENGETLLPTLGPNAIILRSASIENITVKAVLE